MDTNQGEDDSFGFNMDIDGMIQTGLDKYVDTMKTKVVDNIQAHLASFILSLTNDQLSSLQSDQTDFNANSYLYISQ